MHYTSVSELPNTFSHLPVEAKNLAMNVINNSLSMGLSETRGIKSATQSVDQNFININGEWREREVKDNILNVWTDEFKSKTVGEDFFVEGVLYVSNKPDENKNMWGSFDMASDACLEDMKNQIIGREIGVNFKVGVEHEQVRENSTIVPKAKIVDAWIKPDYMTVDGQQVKALVAKSLVNKHHPEFEFIKGSIEGGFLDAYSMEFTPEKTNNITIEGKNVRVLDKIKLGGATFTGQPVCEACKLTDFYCKSIATNAIKKEEKIMTTEMKDEVVETPQVEETTEEVKEEVVEKTEEAPVEKTEDKSVFEKELQEVKSKLEEVTKQLEEKSKELEIKSAAEKTEIKPESKAVVEESKKEEGVELKSLAVEDLFRARFGVKN